MPIPGLDRFSSPASIVSALRRDGAVIVSNLIAALFPPRPRALLGHSPHGSGDDRIGDLRGECPVWFAAPPEPAWRDERGQVGTAADAKALDGA